MTGGCYDNWEAKHKLGNRPRFKAVDGKVTISLTPQEARDFARDVETYGNNIAFDLKEEAAKADRTLNRMNVVEVVSAGHVGDISVRVRVDKPSYGVTQTENRWEIWTEDGQIRRHQDKSAPMDAPCMALQHSSILHSDIITFTLPKGTFETAVQVKDAIIPAVAPDRGGWDMQDFCANSGHL